MTEEQKKQMKLMFEQAYQTMMEESIDINTWNSYYQLYLKTISAKINNVKYASFATRLVFHATRLGIRNEGVIKLATNLLTTERLTKSSIYNDGDTFENAFFLTTNGIDASKENPYIGKDGKDYVSYNELNSADNLVDSNIHKTRL